MTFAPPFQRVFQPTFDRRNASGAVLKIHDTFTDTNGTAIASHTIAPVNIPAASWSNWVGAWDIQGNKANPATLTINVASATLQSGLANVQIDANITIGQTTSANNLGQIVLRYSDANNWWAIALGILSSAAVFTITKVVAGTGTGLASGVISISNNTTYSLSVTARGSVVTAIFNGVTTITATDAHNATATIHGMRVVEGATITNNTRIDDYKIYAL